MVEIPGCFAISRSELYKRKIKLLLMGHEFGVRESLYAFVLFRSVRTSKIVMNI